MSTATAKRYTHAEWETEATRRFGIDAMQWAFVCPACGHRQTIADYKAAGAPSNAVAFSCVGRWSGPKREAIDLRPFSGKTSLPYDGDGPCNYAGGGLICLNPVVVTFDDGKELRVFDFSD